MRTLYQISEDTLDVGRIVATIADPGAGATSTFIGTTRNSFRGKEVCHLEYEAYPPMAERVMAEIGMEVAKRWSSVLGIAIVHRVGRVDVGEASVVIAISAPHRGDAIEACAWGIDRLKALLPVWKKEVFGDGEVWRENP